MGFFTQDGSFISSSKEESNKAFGFTPMQEPISIGFSAPSVPSKNTTGGVDSSVTSATTTLTPDDLEKDRSGVMHRAINDIAIPSLRMLLTQVLNVVDVAIPNKDQNKAVKRTIREDFDTAYFGILGRAYPNVNYANSEGSYALSPAPTKEEVQTLR